MIEQFYSSILGTLIGISTSGQSVPGSYARRDAQHSPKLQDNSLANQMQFNVISRTLIGESYSSAEMQSAYSPAPDNWVGRL